MHARHMLKYHLVVPTAVFMVLIAFGVSFATAIAVGLMTGCTSMMLMMMGGARSRSAERRDTSDSHSGRS